MPKWIGSATVTVTYYVEGIEVEAEGEEEAVELIEAEAIERYYRNDSPESEDADCDEAQQVDDEENDDDEEESDDDGAGD